MKHHILTYIVLILGLTGLSSCNTQTIDPIAPQTIKLSAAQDQFLQNFIIPEQERLSIGISYEEALWAGATNSGYLELVSQIERINTTYNTLTYRHWEALTHQQVKTKSTVSHEGIYDKYNVPEQDKFLENFIYVENKTITLNITEEKAILCGATIEGYRSLRDELKVLDNMVTNGITTYDEIKKCFDAKRDFIVQYGNWSSAQSTKAIIPGETTPPQTYAIIELLNGNRQGSCTFFGSEEIVAALSANYFCSTAVLKDIETGKTLTLIGYNAYDFFKAGLIYPEGGHYSFLLTKGTDNYDVIARFVEKH